MFSKFSHQIKPYKIIDQVPSDQVKFYINELKLGVNQTNNQAYSVYNFKKMSIHPFSSTFSWVGSRRQQGGERRRHPDFSVHTYEGDPRPALRHTPHPDEAEARPKRKILYQTHVSSRRSRRIQGL